MSVDAAAALPADRGGAAVLAKLFAAYLMLAVFVVGTGILRIADLPFALSMPIKLALLAGAACVVLARWRALLRGALAAPEFAALALLAIASAAWSVDAGKTLREAPLLAATTAMMLMIGAALSLRQLILAIAVFASLTAVACYGAVAVFPEARGQAQWPDVWVGVFEHKNALGGFTAFTLPLTIGAALFSRGPLRIALIGGAAVIASLLAISESRTSQLIALFALSSLASAYLGRRRLLTWSAAYIAGVVVFVAAVAAAFATGLTELLFAALGRQPTMSGRLPLWSVVWPFVEQRPLLGWGYFAFWDPEAMRVIDISRDRRIFHIPFYSHNGLIELLLNLGVVGLGFLVIVVVRAFRGCLAGLAADGRNFDLALVVISVFSLLFLNFPEGALVSPENVLWLMMIPIMTKSIIIGNAARSVETRIKYNSILA
jgi:O-antigen ligase